MFILVIILLICPNLFGEEIKQKVRFSYAYEGDSTLFYRFEESDFRFEIGLEFNSEFEENEDFDDYDFSHILIESDRFLMGPLSLQGLSQFNDSTSLRSDNSSSESPRGGSFSEASSIYGFSISPDFHPLGLFFSRREDDIGTTLWGEWDRLSFLDFHGLLSIYHLSPFSKQEDWFEEQADSWGGSLFHESIGLDIYIQYVKFSGYASMSSGPLYKRGFRVQPEFHIYHDIFELNGLYRYSQESFRTNSGNKAKYRWELEGDLTLYWSSFLLWKSRLAYRIPYAQESYEIYPFDWDSRIDVSLSPLFFDISYGQDSVELETLYSKQSYTSLRHSVLFSAEWRHSPWRFQLGTDLYYLSSTALLESLTFKGGAKLNVVENANIEMNCSYKMTQDHILFTPQLASTLSLGPFDITFATKYIFTLDQKEEFSDSGDGLGFSLSGSYSSRIK